MILVVTVFNFRGKKNDIQFFYNNSIQMMNKPKICLWLFKILDVLVNMYLPYNYKHWHNGHAATRGED